jgi:hypothetical protein
VSSPWALYRSIWSPNWYGLEERDAANGTIGWSNVFLGEDGPLDQTLLTDRGTVIGMANVSPSYTSAELDEVLPDAGWGFRCPLPAVLSQSHWYEQASMSLRAKRLVVLEWQPAKLSSFALDRTLAPQGWVVAHGGTPERQGRPR